MQRRRPVAQTSSSRRAAQIFSPAAAVRARYKRAMTYRLPPLNALRAFEAAARHLSFKAAAGELRVTPGAISQQVRSLESILGVKLFDRVHQGLMLTEAGRGATDWVAIEITSKAVRSGTR
jgi:hypothetical protein